MKLIAVIFLGIIASTTTAAEYSGLVFLDNSPDSKISACMEMALQQVEPERKVVSSSVFQDSLFPYFETGTTPESVEELTVIIQNPVVRQRIEMLGIRYLAVVSGGTVKPSFDGPLACGGGGCLGVSSRVTQTHIDVLIWDLKTPHEPLKATGSAMSNDTMIAIVIPIPFIKNTKKPACKEAVQHILEAINGESIKN